LGSSQEEPLVDLVALSPPASAPRSRCGRVIVYRIIDATSTARSGACLSLHR
jgi:hypothetical protein